MAIIVNVCLFYAKFSLDNFDFWSDFYALDLLRYQKFSLNNNFKQLNSFGGSLILSQMKSAPKLVPFFTLNLNSGIC